MELLLFVAMVLVPCMAQIPTECFNLANVHNCETTTYSRDQVNLALQCGASYLPFAENFATQCIRGGENNEFCLNLLLDLEYMEGGAHCAPAMDSDSCTTECRNFLQAAVTRAGCCFRLIFNDRLSELLLGHNVSVSLDACGITAENACSTADFNLAVPSNAETCTFDDYWTRTTNYSCQKDTNQRYIDALLRNPACLPLVKNAANVCSRGTNNKFCFDLYRTSLNPTDPTRTVRRHRGLSNAVSQCANYSTFQTEGCSSGCRDALQAVIEEIGCCINNFNDTVDNVLVPQFSAEVMIACNIPSPGVCEQDFRLTLSSAPVLMISVWAFALCLSLAVLIY